MVIDFSFLYSFYLSSYEDHVVNDSFPFSHMASDSSTLWVDDMETDFSLLLFFFPSILVDLDSFPSFVVETWPVSSYPVYLYQHFYGTGPSPEHRLFDLHAYIPLPLFHPLHMYM